MKLGRKPVAPELRFWPKVDPCRTDGCALWMAKVDHKGYGKFRVNGKEICAHTFLIGPAPKGLQWDHVLELGCTHRHCVWPNHLEVVTPKENIRRSPNHVGKATHCRQGHPYDETNTYWTPDGRRDCRICRSNANVRLREKLALKRRISN